MVPDFVPLAAVVLVLLSLIYFSMASMPFLFVRLDIPEVWRLFRGLFYYHFWILGCTAVVATALLAASGRMALTAEMVLIAATAIALRKTVLQRMDTQQSAWQSGDAAAMRRLRVIHWGGMLASIVFAVTVASSMSFMF
jgi:hypothetical protein